ncbi:MAG: hypothetical protein JNN18_08305 [Rubrivivax sp.]|jgi:hypothetical protein|nr:hypothetical protein [Rubrivivax sp.]
MKTFVKVLGALVVALILVSAATAAALYYGALQIDPGATIVIDDEVLDIAGLGAGHALVAFAAVLFAMLVVFTVVPLALLGALGAVLCGLAVAAVAVGGVALLLFSPLLLVGLVVVWLVRRARRTTIPA